MKSFSVEVRTESNDSAVYCLISLKAFENCLSILENACVFAHDDHVVIDKRAFVPCAVRVVSYESFVCLLIGEGQIRPIEILLFHKYIPSFLKLLMN